MYCHRDEDAPAKIVDPNAKKPAGWLDDAPENIPDPSAVKPTDWDDEEDGEWEPPQIPNPKCSEIGCGEWKAPMIDNPQFKGKWQPPLIDNPDYKVDSSFSFCLSVSTSSLTVFVRKLCDT